MILYLLGGMILLSIALVVYALWPKSGDDGEAIKRRMVGRKAETEVAAVRKKAKESVAKKVVDTVAPMAVTSMLSKNPDEMSKLRAKLSTAGYRGQNAPTTFLASKSS